MQTEAGVRDRLGASGLRKAHIVLQREIVPGKLQAVAALERVEALQTTTAVEALYSGVGSASGETSRQTQSEMNSQSESPNRPRGNQPQDWMCETLDRQIDIAQ